MPFTRYPQDLYFPRVLFFNMSSEFDEAMRQATAIKSAEMANDRKR